MMKITSAARKPIPATVRETGSFFNPVPSIQLMARMTTGSVSARNSSQPRESAHW